MIPGRIGCELALLAILCVLAILLFPATQGPYSAVHGPVTALQAARVAARLRLAVVQAALNTFRNYLISLLAMLSWILASSFEFRSLSLAQLNSILRC